MNHPDASEYAEFYRHYVELASQADIMHQLESQVSDLRNVLDQIEESDASVVHEPYSWTIKQVVGVKYCPNRLAPPTR